MVLFCARVSVAEVTPLDFSVKLEVITKHWDGVYDWAQVWASAIPGAGRDGAPALVVTTQREVASGDDVYTGIASIHSSDFGVLWKGPTLHPELTWRPFGEGASVGPIDFVPGWHAPTGKILATGHTAHYKDNHLMPSPRPRATAYADYDPKTDRWTPWRELEMPDREKFFDAGAGLCQWWLEPDGTILLPIYYKERTNANECYSATVLRCGFDGKTLTYREHGDEMHLDVPRGLDEPSIAFFQGRYYLTIRNDVKGYVTVGDDGLHFGPIKPWTFDDGRELGSYNTQQHWAAHSDGLFLVYTRRGADNDHIIRNRAPLFIGEVDPDKLCVIRSSERILVPERGASLGNFGVATINENETWVTVGECMYSPECAKRGADGSVFAARLVWSRPNRLYQYSPQAAQSAGKR